MTLTLSSPVAGIDAKIAGRRTGGKTKGPPASAVLADNLGVVSVGQLLHHYPRRVIDRSQIGSIRDQRTGAQSTIVARVRKVAKRQMRNRRTMVVVTLYDGTGTIDLTFFNQPWAATMYREGQELAVSGTMGQYRGRAQMQNFEVEILSGASDTVHTGRIIPVHPASEGITTRTIRDLVYSALEQLPPLEDPLPAEIIEAEGLIGFDEAIRAIHFPDSTDELERAIERLKFDELFTLELGVGFRKRRLAAESSGVAHAPEDELSERFVAALPFPPTAAQEAAFVAIDAAMRDVRPMNVLLQGDVGAGKTVVALHAAMTAIASGHQAAIMAPTEVLAGQHGRSAEALLDRVGARRFLGMKEGVDDAQTSLLDEPTETGAALTYAVLTGGIAGKDRDRVLAGLGDGSIDLVIGTHALVQEGVAFADLSLAVIDEQHRFGVHQRMALKEKSGIEPDVLIMTATPIPRTLALTYYGDLDVVTLDELPAGRMPVTTRIVATAAQRHAAYEAIRAEIAEGRQAFVVCAAIDESNRSEVKAAEEEAKRLATDVFPDLSVELLHGKMRPADKERIMTAFGAGDHDVLIATTVIEVGVDVPNATVMLVENAERFGLAQLHQLRGRIGRGEYASTCFLADRSGPDNEIAKARLAAMVSSTDGFVLADEDLRLRGEGTLFDVRQSGMPDLKLARLAEDLDLVKRARARAFALLDGDPALTDHPALLRELQARFAASIDWLFEA